MQFSPELARTLNAGVSTERLLIEPIVSAHAGPLFEAMQSEAIYRWISSTPPKSVEKLRDWWAQRESRLSPDGSEAWLNWAVRRASDGAYVGKLDAEIASAKLATNIGYIIFPPYWGLGYASESVLGVADSLISKGIERIVAIVTKGNESSYRVLEKSGFTRTRVIPENDTIRGEKFDDIEFVRQARME